MRVVTFKMPEEVLDILDEYARSRGISRSEAIREAISQLLEREGYRVVAATREAPLADGRSLVIEVDVG